MHNRVLLQFNYIRDRFSGRIEGVRSGQLIVEVTQRVDPSGTATALLLPEGPKKIYQSLAFCGSQQIVG
jgi:hypothetical protein